MVFPQTSIHWDVNASFMARKLLPLSELYQKINVCPWTKTIKKSKSNLHTLCDSREPELPSKHNAKCLDSPAMACQGCIHLFPRRDRLGGQDEDTNQTACSLHCSCLLNRNLKHYIIMTNLLYSLSSPFLSWKVEVKIFLISGIKIVSA